MEGDDIVMIMMT